MQRTFRAIALTAALAGLGAAAAPALAGAPLVKTQAPGYYRFMLGDFEVTALSDGTVKLPMTELINAKKEAIAKALNRNFLASPTETSVNAYLVNTGSKLVLIDAGAGGLFGPTLGNVATNLVAAGYKPEQVDEIYVTHLHPDHVGGVSANGNRVFPNAVVRADKNDTDFWLSEEKMKAAPESAKGFFQGAMASLNPYAAAGKLQPFSGSTELVPGIRAVSTYGHTPGHTIYEVESKGQKLVLWGDLMHLGAMQFEDPSVTIKFDTDNKNAAKQRKAAYANAAKAGHLAGVAHVPFPGVGHLRAAPGGKGYVWLPLNYSGLK